MHKCDLLNRHELSSIQDRELQRYIDNNTHTLSHEDRGLTSDSITSSEDKRKAMHGMSGTMTSDEDSYMQRSRAEAYRIHENIPLNKHSDPLSATIKDHFITSTGQRVNFTADFPGLISNNIVNNDIGTSCKTISTSSPYEKLKFHGSKPALIEGRSSTDTIPQRNIKSRKGVRWYDEKRARSLSPISTNSQLHNVMSQYGSSSMLGNYRERTASPAYSSLGKHKDDYNRFETARHAAAKHNERQKSEESRFQAFGDRPGSGVEMTTHHWQGGEIITDPSQLPKSIKPRRLYYSPIGDGTVAADGIELKRRPVDLSPRVTITQLTHVDRGQKGHDGVNVYEKSWTNTVGSHPASEAGYGSDFGGLGSGRNSRADALTPSGGDSFGKGAPGGSHGLGPGIPSGYGDGVPGEGYISGSPGAGNHGYGSGTPAGHGYGNGTPTGHGVGGDKSAGYPGTVRPDSGLGRYPYSTLDSRSGHPYGCNGNSGTGNDGRMSVASSVFSDPSYRFDTKTGYLITNPRELIHQYATTTPVAVMDPTDNTPVSTTITKQSFYRKTDESTEERFSPYAPYKCTSNVQSPNKFVRQLRDETITHTQREANTHIEPVNLRGAHADQKINAIRSKTQNIRGGPDDIDKLTQQLVHNLHTSSKY